MGLADGIKLYLKIKESLIRKYTLVVNEYSISINFIVTDELHTDCKEAIHLIKNINAKLVFTDRDYNINKILFYLNQ